MRATLFILLLAVVLGLLYTARPKPEPVHTASDSLTYFMAADSGYCQMSYYSSPEHGRKTAFNETFDSLALTCAMDFNTPIFYNDWLEISYKDKACTVRVNDRMSIETCAKFPNRDLDLSQVAAAKMGMLTEGVRFMKWRKIVKKRT